MNPLSGVLGEAWKLYKAHAAHLLVIAFVIYLAAAVAAALLALAGGIFGAILGSIVELFAAFLLQAALVKAVQDVRDGRAAVFGETISAAPTRARRRGVDPGLHRNHGRAHPAHRPDLFLITIWAVIVPVIVIERSGRRHRRAQPAACPGPRMAIRHAGAVFLILIVVDILRTRGAACRCGARPAPSSRVPSPRSPWW
jgi:hypothetical protein